MSIGEIVCKEGERRGLPVHRGWKFLTVLGAAFPNRPIIILMLLNLVPVLWNTNEGVMKNHSSAYLE